MNLPIIIELIKKIYIVEVWCGGSVKRENDGGSAREIRYLGD